MATSTWAGDLHETGAHDWTGLYVGGHIGYGVGGLDRGANEELKQAVIFPSSVTGLFGGYQAGYNYQLPSGVVLGFEADIAFSNAIDRPATAMAAYHTKLDYVATSRGRLGYATGPWLPFVAGGLAWGQTTLDADLPDGSTATKAATHVGWTAGAGIEFPVSGLWTGKFEYDYVNLKGETYALPDDSLVRAAPSVHQLKLGLNYRLGEGLGLDDRLPGYKSPESNSKDFVIHGQTTVIGQGYPAIRSRYEGPNSLPAQGDLRETWSATAFLGWRLWQGGEFYFNPELDQGFGVGGTLGLAGFANGEAQKAGADVPFFRAQRYFYRQTFGLGGKTETVEDGPNQLGGTRDVDRVTLTIGRFAVGDFFDNNQYAHDPRADFMNWALWEAAAYDFPADLPGFTLGAVSELNQRNWAARLGVFQVPDAPNSDVLAFKTGGLVVELEERYALGSQSGKLRLGGFVNRGHTGNYREALQLAAATPSLAAVDAMAATREQRFKHGFYVNLEHAVTDDLGLFARFSWNDGRNEILSFADVDTSVSGGVSIKGKRWRRPDDVVGVGAAINGISASHRAYLADGGVGLLIGDGALRYREEKVLETYYALSLTKGAVLTTDFQFIADPAYNTDRGPVFILAARLHTEF